MKVVLRLTPLVLVCALASSCAGLSVAAATVNGQRITQAQVDDGIRILKNDPAFGDALRQDPTVARGEGRRQVLTNLIYTTVAEQEAKHLHIDVTTAQADRLMAERAQSDGVNTTQFLRLQHLTLKQGRDIARHLVLDSELEQRVLGNRGVTDRDIKKAYDANKQFFAEAHLQRITVASENDVRDVLTKFAAGTDFTALAKSKSIDPLASSGGDMGFVTLSQMTPQESAAVTRAKPGGVTDPVPAQTSFEIFKVVERRTKPLAEAAPEIRASLQQTMSQQNYQNWLQRRVRSAHVIVNPQYGRFDHTQALVVRSSETLRP